MFVYHPERRLTAFMSGDSDRHVIYVGGLTDTYNGANYLPPLQKSLSAIGFSLVQIFTSSSHTGFGTGSLRRDCEEIDALIVVLQRDFKSKQIVLIGYSTGCQDSILYAKIGKYGSSISAMILQGPVSDREYMQTLPKWSEYLQQAQQFIDENKSDELMPTQCPLSPISAYRYHSFVARGADDDMFSSDLADEELSINFSHLKAPVLLCSSLADEYVPKHVDLHALTARLASLISKYCTCQVAELEYADHAISDPESVGQFVDQVTSFLSQLASH